jgi:pimeloyl-ACP methyl ester carboxylesterase
VAALALGSVASTQRAVTDEQPVGRTVAVPFDYANPASGTFPLYYELGRPFDRTKPTVFAVVDGQQFYVRRNALRGLQNSLFGDRFNVVGIPGRGMAEAVLNRASRDGATDWRLAWSMLRSDQWIEDIERVRQSLVGRQGRISLYGRSGGGFLVHQYLTRYGDHISTVFTQAAVNRFIDASLA